MAELLTTHQIRVLVVSHRLHQRYPLSSSHTLHSIRKTLDPICTQHLLYKLHHTMRYVFEWYSIYCYIANANTLNWSIPLFWYVITWASISIVTVSYHICRIPEMYFKYRADAVVIVFVDIQSKSTRCWFTCDILLGWMTHKRFGDKST